MFVMPKTAPTTHGVFVDLCCRAAVCQPSNLSWPLCRAPLLGTEVRLKDLQFPGSSFLKIGNMFASSTGTSPHSQDCSKIIERGLVVYSQLFMCFQLNPIMPHRLTGIQLEQQTPHKFRVDWEFTIPTVNVISTLPFAIDAFK